MPPTWSHLTSPPRPPFPIPLHDNVFLPIVPGPFSSLRISSSEPALSFVLKGLRVLEKDVKGKGKEVRVSEVKTRRRNTLLVTPGEVSRIRSMSISQAATQPPQPEITIMSESDMTRLPRTPIMTYSRFSSPSTPSSSSSSSECLTDDENNEGGKSVFSTPCSRSDDTFDVVDTLVKVKEVQSSPCPMEPSFPERERLKMRHHVDSAGEKNRKSEAMTIIQGWRSPISTRSPITVIGSPVDKALRAAVKRQRISETSREKEDLATRMDSDSSEMQERVAELGRSVCWTKIE
ncbi:hypothetical protein IAR55_005424 [Kwoniella newhampshirensis]|uniref:Uncharacterized protein n=1 Tax=Kwoniella newhampshirensis TaxID=1651941 RepID=A0AAW0YW74_9TREE